MKEPLSPAEAVRAARLARVVEEPEFEGAEEGRAVALVVHLSDNPMMVAQALRAASDGCADTDGRWERCRAALVVDGGPANLPEAAVDFELVVRHVYAAWQAWVAARPQYAALSPRLFIAAPASVAFALGWLLGHAMKAVPYPYETDSHEAGPRGAELSGRGTDGTGSHDADAHESGPREGGTDETGEPCTSS